MFKKNLLFFLLFIFSAWQVTVLAITPQQELVNLLQNTRTMQANFTQKIYDGSGNSIDKSSGKLELSKPNKFRWQVLSPMNQLVVSNGKEIWTYDADLEQVVIKPVTNAIGATPLAILSGSTDALVNNFTVKKDSNVYKLHAKQPDTNFTDIWLEFDQGTISGMSLFDNLGQKTELTFSKVIINQQVVASDFEFVVPKGIDVVKG